MGGGMARLQSENPFEMCHGVAAIAGVFEGGAKAETGFYMIRMAGQETSVRIDGKITAGRFLMRNGQQEEAIAVVRLDRRHALEIPDRGRRVTDPLQRACRLVLKLQTAGIELGGAALWRNGFAITTESAKPLGKPKKDRSPGRGPGGDLLQHGQTLVPAPLVDIEQAKIQVGEAILRIEP